MTAPSHGESPRRARDADSIAETNSSGATEEAYATGAAGALGGCLTTPASRTSAISGHRIASASTAGTLDPQFEVDWEGEDDPAHPKNWPMRYRAMAVLFLSWNTLVVVLYSTSYTSGISIMASDFHTSDTVVTLGVTFYLFGLAAGSMFMAPLSEMYGRKPVSVCCMLMFSVLVIPCAVAKNLTTLIVCRFFGACFGSVMSSTAPGMVSDLVDDKHRALALSVWSIGPFNGPVVGPIIGGFVTQYLGWRWMNWIVLILSVVALVLASTMKESYAPILLQRKAARLRKQNDDPRWWSRYDQKQGLLEVMKLNLSRPFTMATTEPICIFWNLYLGLIYGILYLCFIAYPIVFRGIRGWSLGISGLAFTGIGIGSMIIICCEPLIRRMIDSHDLDPETGRTPPEAMMSIVCICAILIPVGELFFSWTCAPPSIHWIAPLIATVFFGAGNTGVFIYASNFLAYSYGIYAASAMAGNSVIRSILGGIMPIVGGYLYNGLGPNWSGTLLGLLEVAIIPIPFIFYKYGYKIRRKSTLITRMQEDKQKLESKRERIALRTEAIAEGNEKEAHATV